jgi:CheY-like chemotaxis protein
MLQRVLIADDDELQGEVLRATIEGCGHRVELVGDGLEAVRRLRTGQYDLALLDYRMPQLSGLAAARLLHDFFSDEECPRLIAFTAAAEELQSKNQPSEEKWFDAVVSKHLGLSALISVIDANLAAVAEAKAATMAARARRQTQSSAPTAPVRAGEMDDPFATPPRSDGQVLAVSIAAFKAALGPEWPRVAHRAMAKAEHIVKRHLVAGDILSRSGDHGFVVWFKGTDGQHNEQVLTAIAREVRIRFLTDYGEEAASDICTSSSAIRPFLPSRH